MFNNIIRFLVPERKNYLTNGSEAAENLIRRTSSCSTIILKRHSSIEHEWDPAKSTSPPSDYGNFSTTESLASFKDCKDNLSSLDLKSDRKSLGPIYFRKFSSKSRHTSIKSALKQRRCSIRELVSSEEQYIHHLSDIVNGYIPQMTHPNSDIPLPEDLKGLTIRMIFGNIEDIYQWHDKYFLKALQKCLLDLTEVGPIIKLCNSKFDMYCDYCTNYPKSEYIASKQRMYFDQIRVKLRHKLNLNDLLIKPVQRITKYELLLREIIKHSDLAGLVEEIPSLKEAADVMNVVCESVNSMMLMNRMKLTDDVNVHGKLLLHGPLDCVEYMSCCGSRRPSQKRQKLQVFLLEEDIFFSNIIEEETPFERYQYRAHMHINHIVLHKLPKGNGGFLLKLDPLLPQEIRQKSKTVGYICTAATAAKNQEWLLAIENILQRQRNLMCALENPVKYQQTKLEKKS